MAVLCCTGETSSFLPLCARREQSKNSLFFALTDSDLDSAALLLFSPRRGVDLLLVRATFWPAPAQRYSFLAGSGLGSVKRGRGHSFLKGTTHVLRPLPLPSFYLFWRCSGHMIARYGGDGGPGGRMVRNQSGIRCFTREDARGAGLRDLRARGGSVSCHCTPGHGSPLVYVVWRRGWVRWTMDTDIKPPCSTQLPRAASLSRNKNPACDAVEGCVIMARGTYRASLPPHTMEKNSSSESSKVQRRKKEEKPKYAKNAPMTVCSSTFCEHSP